MSSSSGLTNSELNNKLNNQSDAAKITKPSFIINFLIGGTSESIAKTITAPIERIKILLQSQQIMNNLNLKYTGTINCFSRIIKEQGFIALWRGNMVNMVKYVPTFALNYSLKELFQKRFKNNKQSNNHKIAINFLSGCFSGGTTLIVTYPLDFTRTKIAVDVNKKGRREYNGMIDCWNKYYPFYGIRGIYSGFITAFIGITVYRGCVFGFYDSFKHFFPDQKNIFVKYIYSVLVSGIAGSISLPFDTIRRRLIIEVGKVNKEYNDSTILCIKKIYKQEGFLGFSKGGYANFIRSLGSALTLLLNDYVVKFYQKVLIK